MKWGGINHCCCCSGFLTLAIINSNAAKDDNFEVFLNGTSIGTIDNSTNACTGRIWSETPLATYDDIGVCTTALSPTLDLDRTLLVVGTNELSLYITAANNNGNFGHIFFDCVKAKGASPGDGYALEKRQGPVQQVPLGSVDDNTYSFASQTVGSSIVFHFDWTG